jgi:hypothetical protein
MMNKNEFTKAAKQILRRQRGIQNTQIIHPRREWLLGIFIGLLIFTASATWSTHLYLKYQYVDVNDSDDDLTELSVYRATMVTASLDDFAERQEKFDQLVVAMKVRPVTLEVEEMMDEVETSTSTASSSESVADEREEESLAEQSDLTNKEDSESEPVASPDGTVAPAVGSEVNFVAPES